MTDIDKKKYIICCPLCDNEKCVRGTDKCEAEIWKKEKQKHYQEQEKQRAINDVLDNIRAEIVDTLYVDSLIFGELIDFKNGKISADDIIEEFNRVARIEVLKIIDKYRQEGEQQG